MSKVPEVLQRKISLTETISFNKAIRYQTHEWYNRNPCWAFDFFTFYLHFLLCAALSGYSSVLRPSEYLHINQQRFRSISLRPTYIGILLYNSCLAILQFYILSTTPTRLSVRLFIHLTISSMTQIKPLCFIVFISHSSFPLTKPTSSLFPFKHS